MALERELLNKLLQVAAPCAISDIRVDEQRRRVDVWIGVRTPRSWFGGNGGAADAIREAEWRHVNLGGYHCYIHARLPAGTELAEQPWLGDDKLGFTRAKAKQIFALMSEGVSYEGICMLLDVPFNDLWKFKFALDSGNATPGLLDKPARPRGQGTAERAHAAALSRAPAAPETAVPDATDPVWQELVEGRLPVDIRVLSLQLLLTRMRSQFATIQDKDVRLLKLRDLHRYVIRNERVLDYELSQLRRH